MYVKDGNLPDKRSNIISYVTPVKFISVNKNDKISIVSPLSSYELYNYCFSLHELSSSACQSTSLVPLQYLPSPSPRCYDFQLYSTPFLGLIMLQYSLAC